MDELETENLNPNINSPRRSLFKSCLTAILLLAIIGAGLYYYLPRLLNPCSVPVQYTIGDIDPRFKISRDEVEKTLNDATRRWNSTLGKTVYEENSGAKLRINLVYDERQQKLDETRAKISTFDSSLTTIEQFRAKLESLSTQYQSDLNGYNSDVNYWNSQGGAPSDTYNQLNSERVSLEQRRLQINKMAALLNAQIDDHNSNVSDFNQQLASDKNKIVTSGEYFTNGSKIDIYTYGDEKELRLVLMHELGHALSTDHDSQATSILYPILGAQDLSDPLPSSEDINLVDSKCRLSNLNNLGLLNNLVFHK